VGQCGGLEVNGFEARAREAYLRACELDVLTPKPGNVSVASQGHGMQASMFLASAQASVGPLFERGARVGSRIEAAMQASLAAAGCNTNLGIVLLVAPLACALEQVSVPGRDGQGGQAAGQGPMHGGPDAGALRVAVLEVLDALDVTDAAEAFRAIDATQPGGLGRVDAHDVGKPATITLLEAMRIAAPRDRIAHQYASGFDDVFGFGLEVHRAGLESAKRQGLPAPEADVHAMLGLHLELLARQTDSHIARRHGDSLAHSVMEQTRVWRDAWRADRLRAGDEGLRHWDLELKSQKINPGTTADLCVACAMVAMWLSHRAIDDR
jgi:triphosphoribosyl-dephospho-CoA synthase